MSEEKRIKVLCVEDELEILDTMAEILRDEGFEVFEANNGKRGFESFLENKPDVIISDIMMPELDGYGLLKMVRESKDKNNNAVPFIFLSALGQKDNIIKGVDLLASDYLVKPIDFDILIAKVREKTSNASKVQKLHSSNIANIKSQISAILPDEIFSYLNSITQKLKLLKDEPYGPFPHRRYGEDLNKIYFDSLKLKAAISNALDHKVIDKKLNENEEIFSLVEFIDLAVLSLSEKIQQRIQFDRPYESEFLPKIKINKSILTEIVKKIIAGIVRSDQNSKIKISIAIDVLNQMALIFYITSKLDSKQIEGFIEIEKLKQISEESGCSFKVSNGAIAEDVNIVFSIPSYRVVKN